jgi:hypothetical protein
MLELENILPSTDFSPLAGGLAWSIAKLARAAQDSLDAGVTE